MRTKSILPKQRSKNQEGNDGEAEDDDEVIDVESIDESADETLTESSTWVVLPQSQNGQLLIRCQFENCDGTFEQHYEFRQHFIEAHFPGKDQDEEGKIPIFDFGILILGFLILGYG